MISRNASLNPVGTPDDQIIEQALLILEQRVFKRGPSLQSPEDVRNFLQLKIAAQPHEVFGAVFLDAKHQVLAYELVPRHHRQRQRLSTGGAQALSGP